MNLSRIVALGLVIAAASACGSDEITNPSLPALAGVRFINGLSDSSAVDVRMVDQVEFSFNGIQNKAFRTGSASITATSSFRRNSRIGGS